MTPALPPGFELDEAPALPAGFVLDGAPKQSAPLSRVDAMRDPRVQEAMKRELMTSPPMAWARGLKDIVDTGAGFLSRLGGKDEQARVLAANAAGRAEFDANAEGRISPQFWRFTGNMSAVAPGVSAAGALVAKAAPRLGAAIQSGGMTTGAAPVGRMATAGDMGIRAAGGAIGGYLGAGAVNPEDADTGALIGAALPPAVKVAGYVGQKAGQAVRGSVKHGLGLSTGVGAEPVAQAFRAGKAGNREFLDNMRGDVPIDDILGRAKSGLDAMRAEKSAAYRSGMVPIKGDQSVLRLDDIDAALAKADEVASFKGQVKSQSAADALSKMRAAVDEWRGLDPKEFHTPEGLDALKQKLGDVLEGLPFENKQARLAAGQVYNAAKKTIEGQAPAYAKVMKDYSSATEQIREIERALSLGDKASKDTAMRKLQSLMRNNVQTNYGNRLSNASTLESQGGVELLPSLAGQAMNSWTPRSLAGQVGGGATALMATQNPALAAALPLQSPRLVGNMLYSAGRLSGAASQGGNALAQGTANALSLSAPGADELSRALYRLAPQAAASPQARK